MDYAVSIDPAFGPDSTDAVIAGLADWQKAIPDLQVTYTIAACNSPSAEQVCMHPVYDPPDPSDDVVGSTYPGPADDATVWLYVDRIAATGWNISELTEQTAAHEFGHAIGLKHTATGTLMAADVQDQAPNVTAGDVAQFWAVRGR